MPLHESGEDYLETLFVLEERSGGYVRQIDIAAKMGFSKASISKAMSTLNAEGYVEFGHRGTVRLSRKGREVAKMPPARLSDDDSARRRYSFHALPIA